ncbi:WcaA Glycosyltransferases involved in cell wall biogenesis [Candidatus Methylopumilus planktonicus]|uniref:glycosyltransferase family 2 protein n=1 Tax=Candidatus Methylopumilus planktonicus TaxID=1581557 RepID=UPI003BEF1748
MKLISFVIPTYNFAEFIGETLDSILQEDSSFYEIVIYDGFSTDDTESVVRRYLDKYDFIRYVRSSKRNNIDIDLNNAILEATGRYIWTLSSDDLLTKGWLSCFLNTFENSQSDIYLFPAIHCDIQMNRLYRYSIARIGSKTPLKVYLNNNSDYLSYLEMVRTSEGLFSFCSACVVDRAKIYKTDLLLDANGTCWRYATRIIQMSMTYPTSISIANDFIILKRGDNDSFGRSGILKRLDIATIQWTNSISLLKLNPFLKSSLLKRVHSDVSFLVLFYIKQVEINTHDDLIHYENIVTNIYPGKSLFSWVLLKTPISKYLGFLFMILLKCNAGKIYKQYLINFRYK